MGWPDEEWKLRFAKQLKKIATDIRKEFDLPPDSIFWDAQPSWAMKYRNLALSFARPEGGDLHLQMILRGEGRGFLCGWGERRSIKGWIYVSLDKLRGSGLSVMEGRKTFLNEETCVTFLCLPLIELKKAGCILKAGGESENWASPKPRMKAKTKDEPKVVASIDVPPPPTMEELFGIDLIREMDGG